MQKDGSFFCHTIEYPVKCRDDWYKIKERFLNADDPSRFPLNWQEYVEAYRHRDYPLQLSHGGVYGFARHLMGDEMLSYAFYDDPDLIHDIMNTYTDMCIKLWSNMTACVDFDLIECWEDMAYSGGSFISPQLFRQFMKPVYQKIASFAKAHDIKAFFHYKKRVECICF